MRNKILIVDDEKDVVSLLKDYFEIEGYLVYTAIDGVEAINQLNCNPDIILLDINMPKMDGFEVCKRVRSFINCPILYYPNTIHLHYCCTCNCSYLSFLL